MYWAIAGASTGSPPSLDGVRLTFLVDQYVQLLERAKRKLVDAQLGRLLGSGQDENRASVVPEAVKGLLDLYRTVYDVAGDAGQVTPLVGTPPAIGYQPQARLLHFPDILSMLPNMGEIPDWFDLPMDIPPQ